MGPLPIILGGALFLLATGSKKSSTSSKKSKDTEEGGVVDASGLMQKVKPPRKGRPTCLPTEYYNAQTDSCAKFWIEGETDLLVKQAINEEVFKISDKSFGNLCEDQNLGEFGDEWQTNANIIMVMKNVITKLWSGSVPQDKLPPSEKSPEWLKEIWKRVRAIYWAEICGGIISDDANL